MFAVNPNRYRPVSVEEFQRNEARRAAMMRLTTDRENIAEAEAKARITLDEIAILLAPPGVTSVPGILDGLMPDTTGSSAKIARERLRCIVLQDRETCPAWRWVPVRRQAPSIFLCAAVAGWTVRGLRGDRWCQHLASSFVRSWRKHYRWERRA